MNKEKIPLMGSLVVLAIGATLSACGTNDKSSDSKSTVDPVSQVLAEPAELVFYIPAGDWTVERFNAEYGVSMIEKKFPNYKLKFIPQTPDSTIEKLIIAGQTIDLVEASVANTTSRLFTNNLQSDISDLIKKYNFDLSRLEPSTITVQRNLANGGIYGLPNFTLSVSMFYNKDLFDKFGVAYPKDGLTWDETYELAKRLTRTEDGMTYKGLAMTNHVLQLNELSASLVDSKTNLAAITDSKFARAFENYMRFYKIPGNEPKGLNGFNNFRTDRNIATLLYLSQILNLLGDMNWDVASYPVHRDLPQTGPQSSPYFVYITSMSKQRDAAFQVLSFMTSDEYQRFLMEQGKYTTLNHAANLIDSFGKNVDSYRGKNLNSLMPKKFAEPGFASKNFAFVNNELTKAVTDYLDGKDLNTVLREGEERANKKIAENESK